MGLFDYLITIITIIPIFFIPLALYAFIMLMLGRDTANATRKDFSKFMKKKFRVGNALFMLALLSIFLNIFLLHWSNSHKQPMEHHEWVIKSNFINSINEFKWRFDELVFYISNVDDLKGNYEEIVGQYQFQKDISNIVKTGKQVDLYFQNKNRFYTPVDFDSFEHKYTKLYTSIIDDLYSEDQEKIHDATETLDMISRTLVGEKPNGSNGYYPNSFTPREFTRFFKHISSVGEGE